MWWVAKISIINHASHIHISQKTCGCLTLWGYIYYQTVNWCSTEQCLSWLMSHISFCHKLLKFLHIHGVVNFNRIVSYHFRPDLAKPASTLYTHNLSGVLEAAIRATNAQFEDPDIIKRLDCRLLEVILCIDLTI